MREIIFTIVVFITHIIQAITGFAGTALAMPFSIRLVGLEVARPVLNVVAIIISLILVVYDRKKIDYFVALKILLLGLIGMGIGLLLEQLFNINVLMVFYGSLIILISAYYLIKNETPTIPKKLGFFVIVLAGVIHKWFLTGGPVLVIYATATLKDKQTFRGTLSLVWLLLNTGIFSLDLFDGLYTQDVIKLSAVMVFIIPLSFILGSLVFKRLSSNAFMRIAYLLLLVSGIAMII